MQRIRCNSDLCHLTVITKDRLQRSSGVEVIDLEGDGTAGLVSVSMETDHILDSLTSQKTEVSLFGLVARRSSFLRGRGRLSCAWLCSEDLSFQANALYL